MTREEAVELLRLEREGVQILQNLSLEDLRIAIQYLKKLREVAKDEK
jgi:hypothetical protein